MQDAHEAIRPSAADRTPESIRPYLSNDQHKLYKLIWERFIASQMSSAELLTRSVEITAGDAVFRASATEVKFAGFTIVYSRVPKWVSKILKRAVMAKVHPKRKRGTCLT